MTIRTLTAAFTVAFLSGCSSDKTAEKVGEMNKSNIQRVSNIYAAFQNMKGGRGPKDEAELTQFIADFAPDKLQMMGINKDDTAKLFTSERDGEKFQVRYSVGGGRGSMDAVVFEKAGKDGSKQVGFTNGKVEDADDATYRDLLAGKRPSAPAGPPTGPGAGRPTGPPPGAPKGPNG